MLNLFIKFKILGFIFVSLWLSSSIASANYHSTSQNCILKAIEDQPGDSFDGGTDFTLEIKTCLNTKGSLGLSVDGQAYNSFYAKAQQIAKTGGDGASAISQMASYAYYYNVGNGSDKPTTSYCRDDGKMKKSIWCGRMRQLAQLTVAGKYRNFKCSQKPDDASKKRCQLLADNFVSTGYCDKGVDEKNHCETLMPAFQQAEACKPSQTDDDKCVSFVSDRLASADPCQLGNIDVELCVPGVKLKDAKPVSTASVPGSGDKKPVNPTGDGDGQVAGNEPGEDPGTTGDPGNNETTNNNGGGLGALGDMASGLANSLFGNKDSGEQEDPELPQIDASSNLDVNNSLGFPEEVRTREVGMIQNAASADDFALNARNPIPRDQEDRGGGNSQNPSNPQKPQQPPVAGGPMGGQGGGMKGGSNPNANNKPKKRRRWGSGGLDKVADALGGNRFMSADGGGGSQSNGGIYKQAGKKPVLDKKIRDRIAQNARRNTLNPRQVNAAFQAGLKMSEAQVQESTLPALFFPAVDDQYDQMKDNNDYLNSKGL